VADDVRRVSAHLPISQEALDQFGTLAERLAAVMRGDVRPVGPEPVPLTPAGHMALVEATDGTLRDVVRLHAPMWDLYQYVCRGCDADGYEWEPPQWPCSTVELIADQLGVDLCACGATTTKGDDRG